MLVTAKDCLNMRLGQKLVKVSALFSYIENLYLI